MKKIILVAVLVGVVYLIGGSVSDAINSKDNAAQVFANGTLRTQITQDRRVKLMTKDGKVSLIGMVKIKATAPAYVTFQTPTVFKDGQPYTVASSSFTSSVKRITFARLNTGVTTTGPMVEAKRGAHMYSVQWMIDESALTPGIYTMNLTGYTVATSSTSTPSAVYPLTAMSDTTIIRPTTPAATATTLEGMAYRLVSVRGTNMPASSTVDIAFSNNAVTLKVCNTYTGQYKLTNSRLSFTRLTSTRLYCGTVDGVNYYALGQQFMKAFRDQPLVFLTGDTMTLSSPNGGVMVFKKITTLGAPVTPPTGVQIINGVRTYPCDFIGPLEPGAVRNCGTGLGIGTGSTLTATPTLATISPSVGSIGTTVTLTGTNFSNTRNVVLMDNLNVAGSGLPVAYITTSNGTSLTFVIPSTHICPPPVNGLSMSCNQANLTSGTYHIQVQTPNGTSNNVSMIIN